MRSPLSPRRGIAALLVTVAAIAAAGCGSSEKQSAEAIEASTERTVKHAMGTATVPADPKRVVVLDTGELDSAVTLGVKPVGAVEALPGMGFPEYLGDLDGVETVGTIEEPNLEKIAALEPDLILSNKIRHEQIYDKLAAIAPTVFAADLGVAWKDSFMLDARALGKEDEAKQLMAAYDERTSSLLPEGAKPSVSVVRFNAGQLRLYQRGSFIGTILDDIGVRRPEGQQDTEETWLEGSAERIRELDADILVEGTYGPTEDTPRADVVRNPLWDRLTAVKEGNAHEVDDDIWFLGIGLGAANKVLDDLEGYIREAA